MLTKDQQEARDQLSDFILDASANEIILTGSPGTGKSYLLQDLKNILQEIKAINELGFNIPYHKIIQTATTNKASRIVNGVTIHRILGVVPEKSHRDGKTRLVKKCSNYYNATIFFIDECSMIDGELYSFIKSELLENKCNKIIYVGDKNQLPPVNDDFSIFEQDIPTVELTELLRFKHQDLKDLIENCRSNIGTANFRDFILNIPESENIKIVSDAEVPEILANMTADDKALAYTRAEVANINSYIRKLRGLAPTLTEGDHVVCKSALPATNTTRKTFVEETKIIDSVRRMDSSGFCYVTFTDCSGLYKTFTNPKMYELYTKDLYKKCAYKKDFTEYAIFTESVLHLCYSQATTIHSAQGSTYSTVFINIEDMLQPKLRLDNLTLSKLFYVAVSRAQQKVYLYYGNSKR